MSLLSKHNFEDFEDYVFGPGRANDPFSNILPRLDMTGLAEKAKADLVKMRQDQADKVSLERVLAAQRKQQDELNQYITRGLDCLEIPKENNRVDGFGRNGVIYPPQFQQQTAQSGPQGYTPFQHFNPSKGEQPIVATGINQEVIKKEMEAAAWFTLADGGLQLSKEMCIAAVEKSLGKATAEEARKILDNPLVEALLSFGAGGLIGVTPNVSPKFQRLASYMRVNAGIKAGKELNKSVIGPFAKLLEGLSDDGESFVVDTPSLGEGQQTVDFKKEFKSKEGKSVVIDAELLNKAQKVTV